MEQFNLAQSLVDAAARWWPWLLVAAGLTALALWAVARSPALRDRRDAVLMRLPMVGRFRRMGAAAAFLRSFTLVINSHLPLVEALAQSVEVLDFHRYRELGGEACRRLRRGDSLGSSVCPRATA